MFNRKPAIKQERDASQYLPFARHVNEHVVALDNGEYMAVFAQAAWRQRQSVPTAAGGL